MLNSIMNKFSYSAVLHDDPFVGDEEFFQRVDHSPQVRLVFVVVKLPLGIHHIMHGHQVILGETNTAISQ